MDEIPDPQKFLKLAKQRLSSSERRKKYRKIDFLDQQFWYATQLKFFLAGVSGVHQRLTYGGNQSGKTLCCAAEVTWHATGLYPVWWTGLRLKRPLLIWVVCESVIVGRDTVQKKLVGDNFGDGLVPLEYLARKPRIPSEEVKHISAERRAELADEYSESERDSRIEGLPQLGAGPVYPLEMLPSVVRPFFPDDIPSWAHWSVGVDFGFAGAFAA